MCLRAIQSAQDALDAAKAAQLAALEELRGYEDDGASSVKTWVRNNLRLDPSETNTLVAAGSTLRDLPLVAEAAGRGEIRLAHVKSLTYGIRHIGRDIMVDSQAWLVDVAKTHEPAELHQVVRALREAVFPDSLDKAWADGMAKQDIKITAVPEGCSTAAMPCLRRLHSSPASSTPRRGPSSTPCCGRARRHAAPTTNDRSSNGGSRRSTSCSPA